MPTRIRNLIIIMVLATIAVAGITYFGSRRSASTTPTAPTKPAVQTTVQTVPAPTTTTTGTSTTTTTTGNDIGALTKLDIDNATAFSKKETDFATNLVKQQWDKDAVLYGIRVTYTGGFDVSNAKDIYYFKTNKPQLSRYYWTISIDQQTSSDGSNKYTRVIYPVEDVFPKAVTAIPFQYLKTNFLKAISLADQNGGSAFRKQYKDFNLDVLLSRPTDTHLFWAVTYQANDKAKTSKTFNVDAETGNIF